MSKSPLKSMSIAEIDIVPKEEESNAQAAQRLRREVNPLGIHMKIIELVDPNGNVSVRLSAYNPAKLKK